MKHRLVPGGEIDVLTPAEFDARIGRVLDRLLGDEDTIRADESVKLDANGNGVVEVFVVPPGMRFDLHRVVVDADGFSPAVPFNGAGAWLDVNRSTERVDFLSLVAGAANGGSLPAKFSYSGSAAIPYQNGEQVEVAIFAGPPNASVRAKIQGTLEPLTK